MHYQEFQEVYKKFVTEKDFNHLNQQIESELRSPQHVKLHISAFEKEFDRSLSRLEELEECFEKADSSHNIKSCSEIAYKIAFHSLRCFLLALIIEEKKFKTPDREAIRKSIFSISRDEVLQTLKDKKQLLKDKSSFFLCTSKEQSDDHFSLKFELDALEQFRYKTLLSIKEHERIRSEQFNKIEDTKPENLKDLFKIYEKIYIWRTQELEHIVKQSFPTARSIQNGEYASFLEKKYFVEAMELFLEQKPNLTFAQRTQFIASAEKLSDEEIKMRLQTLQFIIDKPELQRQYAHTGHLESPYKDKTDQDLYGYHPEAYIEIYFIYKFVQFKKTLNQTCDNALANTVKNRPTFLSPKIDEKTQNLLKEAFELKKCASRFTISDPKHAQKLFSECLEKLDHAIHRGSTEAKGLYDLWSTNLNSTSALKKN